LPRTRKNVDTKKFPMDYKKQDESHNWIPDTSSRWGRGKAVSDQKRGGRYRHGRS